MIILTRIGKAEDAERRQLVGSIYRKKGSKFWWIHYYQNGKSFNESSHSDKKTVAKNLLDIREGEIAKGGQPGVIYDRVQFSELIELVLSDYRRNGKKTLDRVTLSANALKEGFGEIRAAQITTPAINSFVEEKLKKGYAPATINRALAALKRAFHLGLQATPPLVQIVPHIPMLKESNVRKGFFEREEFLELRKHLPDPVNSIATFAYYTGWRKGEITHLKWDQVDLERGTVRLNPGETKNDDGRVIHINTELRGEMQFLHMNRQGPYVFHRKGCPLGEFRKSWATACKNAKVEGRLFHDLRRTGVRNMVRAGIPERVAMEISGHKTRSVFERYNIVSDQDLQDAAKKLDSYSSATVAPEAAKEEAKT
jgi:integrase